jgi:hypothetical protein
MRVEPEELAVNFRTSFFIFMIQMALALYSAYGFDGSTTQIGIMAKGNEMSIIVVRFICALALHLQIEGEVLQAIHFMKFSMYRINTWRKRLPMFLISLMQLIGAIATEGLNIVQICSTDQIDDII